MKSSFIVGTLLHSLEGWHRVFVYSQIAYWLWTKLNNTPENAVPESWISKALRQGMVERRWQTACQVLGESYGVMTPLDGRREKAAS